MSLSKHIEWERMEENSILWALYTLPIVACTFYQYSKCVTLDYFEYYIYEF